MTIVDAAEIELFKTLTLLELAGHYYDFHNDYDCVKVSLANSTLTLLFQHIVKKHLISFNLDNAALERFEWSNFSELGNLTVDIIYRGRCQRGDELIDVDGDGRIYVYVDFCEGPNMELWCKRITIAETEE